MFSRTRAVLAIVVLALALIPTTSQAADPSTTAVRAQCDLQNDNYKFTPPLHTTATPGTTTWTGQNLNPGTCLLPVAAFSKLVSASFEGQNVSCTLNTPGVTGTLKIRWLAQDGSNYFAGNDNANTTTVTVNGFSLTATKVMAVSGMTQDSGPTQFRKKRFTINYNSTANTTLCPTTMGLENAMGPGQLLITDA